ncbi:MAG: DHH family phosphoesterase [Thermoplasmata archaeon]
MPSGPESFVSNPQYGAEFSKARELLLAHAGRWRIIYHYDGDGIAAASSALRALGRLGYPAQATPLLGVERSRIDELLKATRGPVLVVDTGASWLDRFAEHPHPVIVLDHHTYPGHPTPPALPPHVAFVDPLDWGVDGMSELCASTLTWLYTVFLDPINWDNAPWGLSGAISDRQHVGGFRGLNLQLLREAEQRSLVVSAPGLALRGPTLADALTQSIDPYLAGIAGRPEEARGFLRALGLDPTRAPGDLPPAEVRTLADALRARLAPRGVAPELLRSLDGPRYLLPSLGQDAEELANLQNAAGRAEVPEIGIALALGDPAALEEARRAEAAWRTGLLQGLRRVEDEGVNPMTSLQWFVSPDTTLAGTQAGMAMSYLLDPLRPVLVFSPGAGSVKVSARGTHAQVARGLDLAEALREAARAVGGEGGGHRIASGATLPPGTEERFRVEVDRRIAAQFARPEAPA